MDAEERFDVIVDELAPDGVLPGALFGSRSLTIDGRAFASFRRARLAVRLAADSPAHAEALAVEGAGPFDPSGKGRPLQDWVSLPADQADAWSALARAAFVQASDR